MKINELPYDLSIPAQEAGIEKIRRSDLFRYYVANAEESEAALLERDFAQYIGKKYAVATNSCGSAVFVALRAMGLTAGKNVASQSFTFTAVTSAIILAGANPVLVDTDSCYSMDPESLSNAMKDGVDGVLVSHMKGNVGRLNDVIAVCRNANVPLIEDAAHALGGMWGDRRLGAVGDVGCFSFQSSKIINAGEGGMIVTDDPNLHALFLIISGAFQDSPKKHFIDKDTEKCLKRHAGKHAMASVRMTNQTAAIVRSQIAEIDTRIKQHRDIYERVAAQLQHRKDLTLPSYPKQARLGKDGLQFQVKNLNHEMAETIRSDLAEKGIAIHPLGYMEGNVRVFWNWEYVEEKVDLPMSREILLRTCDLNLPRSLSVTEVDYIVDGLCSALDKIGKMS